MSRTLKATCAFCGDEFVAERSTAKFCSRKHRTAYNRLPMKIATMWDIVTDNIVQIAVITEEHPHLYGHADAAYSMIEAQVKHQHKKLKKKK